MRDQARASYWQLRESCGVTMTGSFLVMVTTLFFESREPLLPPLPLVRKGII